MKFISVTALVLTLTATPAFASRQSEAKAELTGWSKAAARYESECDAGKLRRQMPKAKAMHAYECFAKIIDASVDIQYSDLYKKLNESMKAAHEDYAAGKSDWPSTLAKLAAASDEYNASVAKRNAQARSND